jgi:hypothetical protein
MVIKDILGNDVGEVLIAGDTRGRLDNLRIAAGDLAKEYMDLYSIDCVSYYKSAKEYYLRYFEYDIAILDKEIPLNGPLDKKKVNGYGLIGNIKEKNPNACIIGLNEQKSGYIRSYYSPDHFVENHPDRARNELEDFFRKWKNGRS